MKRPVFFLMVLLVLNSLACNLFEKTVSPVEKIPSPVLPQASPTIVPIPSSIPTAISSPTLKPGTTPTIPPAETDFTPPPTIESSPTALSAVEDPFDQATQDWNKLLVVTTQSTNLKSTAKVENGALVFNLIEKETYLYQFNKTIFPADVMVQVTFTNLGDLNNGIALVCRAAADSSAWYEARLSSAGSFKFFHYDKAQKTKGNRNPYLEISSGVVNFTVLYPDKANTVRFSCEGSTLTLDFNQGKKVFSVSDEALNTGGLTGVGVISYDVLAVSVAFDDFKAAILP